MEVDRQLALLRLGEGSFVQLVGLRLTALPRDLAQAADKLSSLNASHNAIDTSGVDVLRQLTALEALDLSFNRLDALPGVGVACAARLESLSLDSNRLRTLPDELGQLRELRWLSVSRNAFDDARLPDVFRRLTRLQRLHVASCGLRSLAAIEGGAHTRLEVLDAHDNRLERFPRRLPALERVDLQRNAIAELGDGLLESAPTLSSVRLDDNQLCAIDARAAAAFRRLYLLDVRRNRLRSLPCALAATPHLQLVSAAGNPFDADATLRGIFGGAPSAALIETASSALVLGALRRRFAVAAYGACVALLLARLLLAPCAANRRRVAGAGARLGTLPDHILIDIIGACLLPAAAIDAACVRRIALYAVYARHTPYTQRLDFLQHIVYSGS